MSARFVVRLRTLTHDVFLRWSGTWSPNTSEAAQMLAHEAARWVAVLSALNTDIEVSVIPVEHP